MEPRRIVLAVVLMAAVLLVTPYLFPTPPQAPVAKKPTADSLTTGVSGATAPGATATTPAAGAAAPTHK